MALKYLKRFDTHGEYEVFKNSEDYLMPNVSYCLDMKEVHYDENEQIVAETSNILYYSTVDKKLKLIKKESWDNSLGIPAGIVVSPTSHNNETHFSVISIYGVNVDGSQNPTTNVSMRWGNSGLISVGKTRIVAWDNDGVYRTNNTTGYFPSTDDSYRDKLTPPVESYLDKGTYYAVDATSLNKIPSPYMDDGSVNGMVFQHIYSAGTDVNALNEINGANNTRMIAAQGSNFQAAYACSLYSTSGVTKGEWHLPGGGEFLYVIARLKEINEALSIVGGVPLPITSSNYWTSTEFDASNARRLNCQTGQLVNSTSKSSSYLVRPMAFIDVNSLLY